MARGLLSGEVTQSCLLEKPGICHQLYFPLGLGLVLTSQGAQVRFPHLSLMGQSHRRNWLSSITWCHTPPVEAGVSLRHQISDSDSVRACHCSCEMPELQCSPTGLSTEELPSFPVNSWEVPTLEPPSFQCSGLSGGVGPRLASSGLGGLTGELLGPRQAALA